SRDISSNNQPDMGHCDTTSSVLRFIILKIPKMMKRRASASLAGRRPAKQNAHSVPFWNQMSEKSRLICLPTMAALIRLTLFESKDCKSSDTWEGHASSGSGVQTWIFNF
ncbi:hypothetical protein, partial [Vescimonas sp.]|uniref:hypothetical protein n=1 Tax=Vescimonas sp. TaxID=2892404 RepID=UPI00307D37BE